MKKTLSPRALFERSITENDVLGAIRNLLELNGARVHRIVERIPWGKTKSEGGIPDLFGWINSTHLCGDGCYVYPRGFFIEVKKPGGKLRPAQAAWIQRAQADGVVAFKAESVEEMVSQFKKYGIDIKGLS